MDVVFVVAGLDIELARSLGDLLEDEVGVEEDRLSVDLLAMGGEQLHGFRLGELDTDIGENAPPAGIQGGHGFLGEDLVPRHRIAEHGSPCCRPETLDECSGTFLDSDCGTRVPHYGFPGKPPE